MQHQKQPRHDIGRALVAVVEGVIARQAIRIGGGEGEGVRLRPVREKVARPRQRAFQQAQVAQPRQTAMATAAGLETLDATLNTATLAQDPDNIQAQGVFAGQVEGVRAM